MRNPIGEDLGGVQESGRTHLARPAPLQAKGGADLIASHIPLGLVTG